jgi:tryptophanyl-tRNA synthetase
LAVRFNGIYGDTFKVPNPFIPPKGARVMSLQSPESKMSKSDANSNGYVLMLDEPDVIMKKVKKSVTDSIGTVRYEEDIPERAGMNNLMNIYSAITGKDFGEIEREFDGRGYGDFKGAVGEAVVGVLAPIQENYHRLSKEEGYVREVYEKSAERAREMAQKTLDIVYAKVGFIRR